LHSLSRLERLKSTSLFPLSTTFVHILAQGRSLSKGKFQQIIEKAGGYEEICNKHKLAGPSRAKPQPNVLSSLIQVARDVLVKQEEFRLAA